METRPARYKTINLEDFPRELEKMQGDAENLARNFMRYAGVTALSTIVLATPVDKGRARANWVADIDEYPSDLPKDSPGEDSYDWQGNLADQRDKVEASSVKNALYISNNLPYIGLLNAGSSAQAPAAFVEEAVDITIDALIAYLRR